MDCRWSAGGESRCREFLQHTRTLNCSESGPGGETAKILNLVQLVFRQFFSPGVLLSVGRCVPERKVSNENEGKRLGPSASNCDVCPSVFRSNNVDWLRYRPSRRNLILRKTNGENHTEAGDIRPRLT